VTPYFETIKSLLRDPRAYTHDEGGLYWGLVGPFGDSEVEFGRGVLEFDKPYQELGGPEAHLSDLFGATNPILLVYWLSHGSCGLDDNQRARHAYLLKWDDPRVLYYVSESLSLWFKDPEHMPKLYGPDPERPGYELQYPNLKEVVSYWKEKFGIR